jgi:hypothetical protein
MKFLTLGETLMSLFKKIKFPKNRGGGTDENKIEGKKLKNQARKNYLNMLYHNGMNSTKKIIILRNS